MQAYEFSVQVTADGKLELPDAALPKSLENQTVRVIVLVNNTDAVASLPEGFAEQTHWQDLTATQFLAGYSSADAIYDEI